MSKRFYPKGTARSDTDDSRSFGARGKSYPATRDARHALVNGWDGRLLHWVLVKPKTDSSQYTQADVKALFEWQQATIIPAYKCTDLAHTIARVNKLVAATKGRVSEDGIETLYQLFMEGRQTIMVSELYAKPFVQAMFILQAIIPYYEPRFLEYMKHGVGITINITIPGVAFDKRSFIGSRLLHAGGDLRAEPPHDWRDIIIKAADAFVGYLSGAPSADNAWKSQIALEYVTASSTLATTRVCPVIFAQLHKPSGHHPFSAATFGAAHLRSSTARCPRRATIGVCSQPGTFPLLQWPGHGFRVNHRAGTEPEDWEEEEVEESS